MEDFPIFEYLSILRRRKKVFLITFITLFFITVIFALNWSNYKSVATVEIEQSEIASEITETAGNNISNKMEALADLRISRIQQKITSTASLVDIITKFNLYASMRRKTPISIVADKMRKKIKLELVSSMLANPASAQKASAGQLSAIAFNLSFEYNDPLLSQQVTNELVSRFLNEDLKKRRIQTETTVSFIDKQIELLEDSLVEQEKKIAKYREKSGDTRPEALMFNQQAAATISINLQTVDTQIATTKGNIRALKTQLLSVDPYSRSFADGQILTSPLMQFKALQTKYATLTAQYGPKHPDVLKTKRQLNSLKKQVKIPVDTSMLQSKIDEVKTKLSKNEKTLGKNNPEIKSLNRQLKNLMQQKIDAEKSSSDTDKMIKSDADNPTYLIIVSRLRESEGRYKGLIEKRKSLLLEQKRYRKAVLGNPIAEQQLAALSRDYENSQIRYRELKAKKMSADMNMQLEKERKGQRMSVINPPELPLKTKPSKIIIFIGGFILSIFAGLAAVIAIQILSQSIYGANHLSRLVGVPPLTSIPYITTQAEDYRIDRQKRYAIGALALLLIIIAIIFSFTVMPIDVLLNVIIGRLGI